MEKFCEIVNKYFPNVRLRGVVFYFENYLFRGINFKNKKVMDIGCGVGLIAIYLACKGAKEVLALEPDKDKIKVLKEVIAVYNFHQIRIREGAFQDFESNEKFDFIVSHNSINHLDEEACIRLEKDESARAKYRRIFEKIFSFCHPGSIVTIADVSKNNFFNLLGVRNPFCKTIDPKKHCSPGVWYNFLEALGFKKIQVRWTVFNRLGTPGKLLFANRLCSYFGQGRFIIVAQGSSLSEPKEHILMVIGQYYPIVGGAEKQCQNQAEELAERGYEVTVVTGRWSKRLKRREQLKGVSVIRIDNLNSLFGIKRGSNLSFCFNLFLFLCFSLKKFDIIHIHQALRPAVFCILANMFYKRPSIVKLSSTGSGNDFKIIKYGKENSLDKIFRFYKLLKKTQKVVALNSQIYKELIDEGFSPQKILFIPNGVRIGSIRRKKKYNTNNILRIVSIGRLISDKGFDTLLEAVAELENVHLDIFGKIFNEKTWLEKLNVKRIQDVVTLKGFHRDLSNILHTYDLFILPSIREGMSNSLLEAMSCGLPCIVTDIVGNLEVLCSRGSVKYINSGEYLLEKAGILVKQADTKGLRKSIDFLRHDVKARENIGIKGRERVEKLFSISNVMDQYCSLYSDLLS